MMEQGTRALDDSDLCTECACVIPARDIRRWRDEFGIWADERPHMQDVPGMCSDCVENVDLHERREG